MIQKLPTIPGLPGIGKLKIRTFGKKPELHIKKLMSQKLVGFMKSGSLKISSQKPKFPKVSLRIHSMKEY